MDGERPQVLLGLTPLAERAIEPLLFGKDALLTPAESVAEADELKRLAHESDTGVVLLSPGLPGLTSAICERLRADGLRLIGIALDEDEHRALGALSIESIVSHDTDTRELLAAVREQPAPAVKPAGPPTAQSATAEAGEGDGVVVAVVGCKGAPGSSECAASLAAAVAGHWPVLLLELDMLGGGLDVRVGADAQDGSLLGLARAATTGETNAGLLERWVTSAPGWPPVLLAPADPETAVPDLAQPGVIGRTLGALRPRVPFTVCDVGFLLAGGEQVPEPARVHREALVCADVVLLVLGARETQQRAGFAQLRLLTGGLAIPPQRLRVAVNGVGAPGAASEQALKDTLAPRLAEHGLEVDAWLPWDARALSLARRRGQPLASARPRGRYAKATARLLEEIFVADGLPRARRPRLTVPLPRAWVQEREEVPLPWQS
jgi:Flp pilus assembly CpaE family ATPase